MNKIGHLFAGVVFGAILILLTHYFIGWFNFSDLLHIGLLILIIYVYSLIPDGDMKNSAITWTLIPIGLIMMLAGYGMGNIFYMFLGFGLILVTYLCAQFLPHRGFTHSILFGILVSLPWIYVSYEYALLAFLCFYSHLILDKKPFKII
jgi:membrane-bound metal-dependent hydrolase YbcI (DUF457 family)